MGLSFWEKKEKRIFIHIFFFAINNFIIMEKRIELERRGKEPAQVKELNLDNARATQIEGLTDEYANLETLSLINVGLTTLKGFPKLASLKKLELSDNRISNGLQALQECPKLSHLNLSNNKLKDLEAIEPLKSFEALTHLDLFNNDICNIEDYRTKVFKLLPNLKFLDDADADDNDEEESDDEGANGAEEGDEDDGEDDDDEVEGEEDEDDSDELSDEEDDDDIDDEDDQPTATKRQKVEDESAD